MHFWEASTLQWQVRNFISMEKNKTKQTKQKHSYDTRNSFVTPASDSLSVGLVGAILMASLSPFVHLTIQDTVVYIKYSTLL